MKLIKIPKPFDVILYSILISLIGNYYWARYFFVTGNPDYDVGLTYFALACLLVIPGVVGAAFVYQSGFKKVCEIKSMDTILSPGLRVISLLSIIFLIFLALHCLNWHSRYNDASDKGEINSYSDAENLTQPALNFIKLSLEGFLALSIILVPSIDYAYIKKINNKGSLGKFLKLFSVSFMHYFIIICWGSFMLFIAFIFLALYGLSQG